MRLLAALLAGLLLCASDQPLVLWWLQLVALVPLWWALGPGAEPEGAWKYGLVFGAGYGLPLLFVAGPDLPILVASGASLVQWFLIAIVAARCLRLGPLRGPLATAAVVTLLELLMWRGVPIFGTAQAFVRPLSAAPWAVAFTAYTGVGGLVFAVCLWNGLLTGVLFGPERRRPLCAGLGLLALLAGLDWQRWTRPLGPAIQVAAVGWDGEQTLEFGAALVRLEAAAAEAADQGARLLVSPELGVSVPGDGRDSALQRLGSLAAQHGLTAVFGVWHLPTGDNRAWFFTPEGSLAAEYIKTHLVPWMEDYRAGPGETVDVPFEQLDPGLGALICQDDNFTDLARRYGRSGTRLLAIPTADWPSIRGFHLENSIFRCIESGYAVVRAASGGISALISPRGELLASRDHPQTGPGLIIGPLPIGDGISTLYAHLGDLPIALLCLAVLFYPRQRRRPSQSANSAAAELSGVP